MNKWDWPLEYKDNSTEEKQSMWYITLIEHRRKIHMIIPIDAEKEFHILSFFKKKKKKNTKKTRDRKKLPQYNEYYLWKTHC